MYSDCLSVVKSLVVTVSPRSLASVQKRMKKIHGTNTDDMETHAAYL